MLILISNKILCWCTDKNVYLTRNIPEMNALRFQWNFNTW